MTYAPFVLMWDEENGRFNTQLDGIMAIAFCQLYELDGQNLFPRYDNLNGYLSKHG